jgi:hypothetical protein
MRNRSATSNFVRSTKATGNIRISCLSTQSTSHRTIIVHNNPRNSPKKLVIYTHYETISHSKYLLFRSFCRSSQYLRSSVRIADGRERLAALTRATRGRFDGGRDPASLDDTSSRGQPSVSLQEDIDLPSTLSTFVDRPYDKGLSSPSVTTRPDSIDATGIGLYEQGG